MKRFLEFILGIYFDTVVVRGTTPQEGGVIIAANHPNMLLDPVVCSVYSGRNTGFAFWAKSTLFKGVSGTILSILGAVPVQRQKDMEGGGNAIDNEDLFASSVEALHDGRALLLFPEGVSYTDSHIQELKTGGARVAQGYLKEHGKHVPIVPCGINYLAKDKFRSHVVIEYGDPLYLDTEIENEKQQVRDLTKRLESALVQLTINADDMDSLLDIRIARNIYVDGKKLSVDQHYEITKKFTEVYRERQDREEVKSLKDKGEHSVFEFNNAHGSQFPSS